MDFHKTSFVGVLTVLDYSGGSDLLFVMKEPVAVNNTNGTAEVNQPLAAYRKQLRTRLSVFYSVKLCSVLIPCPTAYRASFKMQ